MKKVPLGGTGMSVPAVIIGCMRIAELDNKALTHYIHSALDAGANYFDHADIYNAGVCEEHFGAAMKNDPTIRREDIILQSKCGIRQGFYDSSKEHILSSVDAILKRLGTDYLDVLLIHRPDALVEPEEVAEAFEQLHTSGKVLHFGVSNHKPMQIELLKKYVRQPLIIDQLQFSLPVSNMVANGVEVNMDSDGAADRDGSVLDWCRLNDVTIQAWSPLQMPNWQGCFIGSEKYRELNRELDALAEKYSVSSSVIAAAWILRHPAKMQLVSGTSNEKRMLEMLSACDITLTREEWYRLFLSAGHILP